MTVASAPESRHGEQVFGWMPHFSDSGPLAGADSLYRMHWKVEEEG